MTSEPSRPTATDAPSSTQPPPSSAPDPAPSGSITVDSLPVAAWLDQLDTRHVSTPLVAIRGGADTTARLIIDAGAGDGTVGDAAVLLDDDRVVPLPDPQMQVVPVPEDQPSVIALGGRLAVVVGRNDVAVGPPELWLLDVDSLTWSPGPALVDGPMSWQTAVSIAPVADGIVVMLWDTAPLFGMEPDSDLVPVAVVSVSDELVVTPLSPPPDDTVARWDVVTDEHALSMIDTVGNRPPKARPWAFHLTSDSWTQVPNPSWLPCADTVTCDWSTNDDDDRRPVAVGNSVLVEVAPEDLGLLDSATLEWTNTPEPPFSLRAHHLIPIGDDLVLAMPTDYTDEPSQGQAGLLDLTTAAWTNVDIETNLAMYQWTHVDTDTAVLLGDHEVEPRMVFDLTNREFREATPDERNLWLDRMTGWSFAYRVDELAAAYTRRNG